MPIIRVLCLLTSWIFCAACSGGKNCCCCWSRSRLYLARDGDPGRVTLWRWSWAGVPWTAFLLSALKGVHVFPESPMVVTVSPIISKGVVLHLLSSCCPHNFHLGITRRKWWSKAVPWAWLGTVLRWNLRWLAPDSMPQTWSQFIWALQDNLPLHSHISFSIPTLTPMTHLPPRNSANSALQSLGMRQDGPIRVPFSLDFLASVVLPPWSSSGEAERVKSSSCTASLEKYTKPCQAPDRQLCCENPPNAPPPSPAAK